MNSPVSATPISAASTEASTAASPSVAPTVRCSITSTGTGSAPPLMRTARSPAVSWLNRPVIWVADPAPAHRSVCTAGEEMTSRSSTIAMRRTPVGSAQARCTRVRHCGAPSPLNDDRDHPLADAVLRLLGAGVLHAVAVEELAPDQDPLAVLVARTREPVGRCWPG